MHERIGYDGTAGYRRYMKQMELAERLGWAFPYKSRTVWRIGPSPINGEWARTQVSTIYWLI